jgi:putative glutamine amidotransferase
MPIFPQGFGGCHDLAWATMTRPLIALSGRRKTGRNVDGIPDSLDHIELDLYFADYARGVYQAGGLPVPLPVNADPYDYAGVFDGILLPGGADVDPALYGAPAMPDYPIEPERDAVELGLLRLADVEDLPVAGICRGMQLMNVYAGGSLHQDVPVHAHVDKPPNHAIHDVSFTPDSICGSLYGTNRPVNSLHHQTVDRVAAGFRVTATDPEGTVEAIEAADKPWLAVQWHPEMMDDGAFDPIFEWLVRQAGRRRRS